MPTIIDTRKAFRRLQERGGFNEDQADAIVDVLTNVDEQVATKGGLDELGSALKKDIKDLGSDLEGDIKDLRSDLEGDIKDLRSDLEDLESDLEQTERRIMTKMDARLAKLERRLLLVGIPAIAALLAIFEFVV